MRLNNQIELTNYSSKNLYSTVRDNVILSLMLMKNC